MSTGRMSWLVDLVCLLSDGLRTVVRTGRTPGQRLRHLGLLVLWCTLLPALALGHRLCLALDTLFWPDLRGARPERPLIVLGNHRTGSTFLHRLLARDTDTFSTARLYDVLFPSLLQKRGFAALGRLDVRLGRPLGRALAWLDARWATDYRNVHPMGIALPEEDEYWLLLWGRSAVLWELFPRVDRLRRHFWVDTEMPRWESDRALAAYAACAARCHRFHGGATWLTKNPLFTPKAAALRRAFPDARFLVLVRDPHAVVPSTASLLHAAYRGVGSVGPDETRMEVVHEICHRFYDEPLAALEGLPPDQLVTVRYEDLKADLAGELGRALGQLGLPLTDALRQAIDENDRRSYRRTHAYDMADWGLDAEGLRRDYRSTLTAWGYPLGAETG